MYIPPHFAETDPSTLQGLIRQNGFGILISQDGSEPFATHLPMQLDPNAGEHGCLLGHVARANPHWKHWRDQTSLAIFNGPHAYVSPTWYQASNMVPTWNYLTVHCYGRVEAIEDLAVASELLKNLVAQYESNEAIPWTFDADATFIERLIAQIVPFRMVIQRIEGKYKLNQNHPAERRMRVIAALEAQGKESSSQVAQAMLRHGPATNE